MKDIKGEGVGHVGPFLRSATANYIKRVKIHITKLKEQSVFSGSRSVQGSVYQQNGFP